MSVTVLMATRNGAAHLPDQLASLVAQTHRDWRLLASDDGSVDTTRDILLSFGQTHPHHFAGLLAGPRKGSAVNFLSLLLHPDLPPGAVALCDQDDVWLRGKLARALRRIAAWPSCQPVLYAAESWLTDAGLRRLGRSTANVRPDFANALVQNLCSGHTMVLNEAAAALVRRAGLPQGIAFHDWWIYQLVTGAGGICVLDPTPVALYRQHGDNALGAPNGWGGAMRRLGKIAGRDYGHWLDAHHRALAATGLMTPQAMGLLDLLIAPQRIGPARAALFHRLGLYRAGRLGTAALWCAAAAGRA